MQKKIDIFLAHMRQESSENTASAYQNDLGQFSDFLTHRRRSGKPASWAEITSSDVIDYVVDLRQREYAPASIARKVAAVKSFFHYLVSEHVLVVDPTDAIESPHVKKNPPRTITRDKIDLLLAEPARQTHPKALRDTALLEFLYATGMRVSEIVALNVADVNLTDGTITSNARGSKSRQISINGHSLQALQLYAAKGRTPLLGPLNSKETAFFVNHRGQRLTRQGLWLIVKYYADTIGITEEVTPHILRHSFAAHKLASGEANVRELQAALGHASRATTQVYAELARQSSPQHTATK